MAGTTGLEPAASAVTDEIEDAFARRSRRRQSELMCAFQLLESVAHPMFATPLRKNGPYSRSWRTVAETVATPPDRSSSLGPAIVRHRECSSPCARRSLQPDPGRSCPG